jgi:hypothetical protein
LLTEVQLSSSTDSTPTATAMHPDAAISSTRAALQSWSTVTIVTKRRCFRRSSASRSRA